jgi:hypothetical protein
MDERKLGMLLRIVGALDSLMQMVAGQGALDADDRVTIYNRTRVLGQWAIRQLTEDQAELLKSVLHPRYFDIDEDIMGVTGARASLAVLHGYLHGCIAEAQRSAQVEANARAYAEAKVKEERGVGFRPA